MWRRASCAPLLTEDSGQRRKQRPLYSNCARKGVLLESITPSILELALNGLFLRRQIGPEIRKQRPAGQRHLLDVLRLTWDLKPRPNVDGSTCDIDVVNRSPHFGSIRHIPL